MTTDDRIRYSELGPDYSPDVERRLRAALKAAHSTDLAWEAWRVIGRERGELRAQINRQPYGRSEVIESVMAKYSGHGQVYGMERADLLNRLRNAARKRERDAARRQAVPA